MTLIGWSNNLKMSNEEKIIILKNKRELINAISPSFCTAKWLQTTLYLQNGYNHSCHHPSPHKIQIEELANNKKSLFNSQHKKTCRSQMLAGERPQECSYCWSIEDLSNDHFSDRHYKTADYWAWDRFEEIANSDPGKDVYPSYLEVSFSNACNFKCVYCSPEISSLWLEEIKEYGPYPISQSNHNLEWLRHVGRYPYKHSDNNPYVDAFWELFPEVLTKLKVFRITGGEPLMAKDTWKVLEYIKQNPQPDLELAINTNLCVDNKLIDRFIDAVNDIKNSVKRINIYTSLESTSTQAEYTRFGLDYNSWLKNIRRVLSETGSTVSIMTTVNILSLPTFSDFIEVVMQLRKEFNTCFEYNRIPLSVNRLNWPAHLSVMLLPLDVRQQYSKKIIETCEAWLKYHRKEKFARLYLEEWDQIQRLCNFMTQEKTHDLQRTDFINFIKEVDRRRGTSFIEVFPEFADIFKDWECQNV